MRTEPKGFVFYAGLTREPAVNRIIGVPSTSRAASGTSHVPPIQWREIRRHRRRVRPLSRHGLSEAGFEVPRGRRSLGGHGSDSDGTPLYFLESNRFDLRMWRSRLAFCLGVFGLVSASIGKTLAFNSLHDGFGAHVVIPA